MPSHFVNLSRGVLCPHLEDVDNYSYVRIQSTHCEQKTWNSVLVSLGAHFYVAAVREEVVVHDVSEKPRETRAMHQGLSWIRYALSRTLYGESLLEYSPSGMLVSPYWEKHYRMLPDSTLNMLKYYRKFAFSYYPGIEVKLSSCWKLGETK